MVKMLTAHTMEIDDVGLAVEEVLSQLDMPGSLLKNTAGVLTCYSEFIDSGVVGAICGALPFDVIGATTVGNADRDERGLMMLSLTVLTSDDVSFSAAYSDSLAGEQEQPLRAMYDLARIGLDGAPKLMISCLPLLFHIGGDETIAILDSICQGVPNFGTTAVDHTPDYRTAQTIMNGESSKDRMAILLLSGEVHPKFFVTRLSEERIAGQKPALITASSRNLLMEVNGMPVIEHMESLGMTEGGKLENVNAVPYVVDFGDGTPPLIRAIFAFTPEGYAVCGGVMPENATLSVGFIDHTDIMRTTERAMNEVASSAPVDGVLIFSCLARFLALGVDTDAEMELIGKLLPECVPYQFSYAGGEICPVYDQNGMPRSRFHNDTLVVLAL